LSGSWERVALFFFRIGQSRDTIFVKFNWVFIRFLGGQALTLGIRSSKGAFYRYRGKVLGGGRAKSLVVNVSFQPGVRSW